MDCHVRQQLEALEQALVSAPALQPFNGADWASGVPDAPGVYVLWDLTSGAPIYVGETACLVQRIADFGRYVNHSARRKLAANFKLDRSREAEISAVISNNVRLSFVELHFGRKELEEYLTYKWSGRLLNSTTRRAHAPNRFRWVTRRSPARKFSRRAAKRTSGADR